MDWQVSDAGRIPDSPPGSEVPGSPRDALLDPEIERRVDAFAAGADPVRGLFGPASVAWHVFRENAVLLGGARALFLQLAHPAVATAVAEHSNYETDPAGRALRTFEVAYTIAFGDRESALDAARRMRLRHAPVRGRLPSGAAYHANDPAHLLWVMATLLDTGVDCYDRLVAPLSWALREALWVEFRPRLILFGIPPESTPPSWRAFSDYVRAMLDGPALLVTPAARRIADALLAQPPSQHVAGMLGLDAPRALAPLDHRPLRPLYLEGVRLFAAGMLPRRLRDGYGLAFDEAHEHRLSRLLQALRRLTPVLPARLRYTRFYREALRRL